MDEKFASLATRLAVYGLERREQSLLDLKIEEDQTVELSARDHAFSDHYVNLKPQRLADLKRWIGIPDEAVQIVPAATPGGVETRLPHLCAPHIAQPPILPGDPDLQSHLHRYLFGHSDGVERQHISKLEAFVLESNVTVSAFVLRDIYISKRSRLVISAKTQLLFARYITIETTGLLDLRAPFARIDCAGIRRLPPFVLQKVDPSTTTLASHLSPRGSD